MDNWEMKMIGRINYFQPFLGEDGGNYTKVNLDDGEEVIITKKTKTFLGQIINYFTKDIKLLRRQASSVLGYSRDLPLLLTPGLVLIPYKVRTASFKDEGTRGYAILHKITRVTPNKEKGTGGCLLFHNNDLLVTLNTSAKLKQKLVDGRELSIYEQAKIDYCRLPRENKVEESNFSSYF